MAIIFEKYQLPTDSSNLSLPFLKSSLQIIVLPENDGRKAHFRERPKHTIMKFQVTAEIDYSVLQQSAILLNIHALPTQNQTLENESFTVTQGATCEFFPLEIAQNRYVRIHTGDLSELRISYSVTAETRPDSRRIHQIEEIPIVDMSPEALKFLFPSRYCQSDRLGRLAANLFGDITHPLAQASAISDWIFENIAYVPGASESTTSACDTLVQRAGVCRDFAHLGIALCRSLSIPARYFTGYACNMVPQDFHACFEVCVGNQWFIFDPTRLSSPDGLVRIGSGRDAADAAVATIFGSVNLNSMRVDCTSDHFSSMSVSDLEGKAVLLEP